MQVFVTGATGYIGSAVVRELSHAGHHVVGLARSSNGGEKLNKIGAAVHPGSLEDLDSLRSGAAAADGVIHLAFQHEEGLANFANSLKIDLRAVEAMGAALEGSGKPFVITNHRDGQASEKAAFARVGVRTSMASLAPTVHGEGDHGFVPALIAIARKKGVSAYVGDGSNRWPAVHRLDAATLYRLALEKAPAGSRLTGRAEEVPFRAIAEVIGKHLNLPVVSIAREEADAHFGFLGALAALDIPSMIPGSSAETRELLGWQPTHPTLIADLEQGHYFKN
ncbi:MAG: SDR family oxidoreductase [Anaerolineales bacterium]